MKKTLQIISLILLINSCSHKIEFDSYKAKYSSSQIKERIEKYYTTNLVDSLYRFLNEWHNSIPPVSVDFINQNDTMKNIYQIFTDLYQPFKFGDYHVDNYFDNKNKYIIIQGYMDYAVVSKDNYKNLLKVETKGYPDDTIYDKIKTKTLLSFRPKLSIDSIKYLYLTKEYRQALCDFLGTDHHELGEGDIMNTAFPKNETENRYKFVCPVLPIVYGHWGGYWHIETFPIIYKIVFDDSFQHAMIDFRSSVGQTVMQYKVSKVHGQWESDKYRMLRIMQE
jgi:hypothetical protein